MSTIGTETPQFSDELLMDEIYPGLVIKHTDGYWSVVHQVIETPVGSIAVIIPKGDSLPVKAFYPDDFKWPIGDKETLMLPRLGNERYESDVKPFISQVEVMKKTVFPRLRAFKDELGSRWWARPKEGSASHLYLANNPMAISTELPPGNLVMNIGQLSGPVQQLLQPWLDEKYIEYRKELGEFDIETKGLNNNS